MQTAVLLNGILMTAPVMQTVDENDSIRTCSILYSKRETRNLNVCKRSFKHIYGITRKRIKFLLTKIKNGVIMPTDLRGKHQNRPNKIPDIVCQSIAEHIATFPSYESHYVRNVNPPGRLYLDPALNLSIMYGLYDENRRQLEQPECEEWLYRDAFYKQFNLKIGNPKQDTWDPFDRFLARMKNNEHLEIQELFNIHRDQCNSKVVTLETLYALK